MTSFELAPIVLEGSVARLEPLAEDHVPDLFASSGGESVWRYMPCPAPRSVDDTAQWVRAAVAAGAAGGELPFAIVDRASGRAVGSTRYLDVRPADRGLEIGWTWLARAAQRTAINTECKLLLLGHAFDALGAVRVQLKTDGRNERSQRALERLGAKREGVLRRSRLCWDGVYRDTVYYSVLPDEWPAIRARLVAALRR